jgi:hypothetical protein
MVDDGEKTFVVVHQPGEYTVQKYGPDGAIVERFSQAEFDRAMRGPRKGPKRAARPLKAKARRH